MQKESIFYLITRSELGGAQTHVLELLRGLKDSYSLSLGSGEEGPLLEEARRLGVNCHLIPSLARQISPLKDWKAYCEIKNILDQEKPRLLHAHSSKAGILGRLAAWRCRIPSVFTAHGWAFAEGTPVPRKIVAIVSETFLGKVSKKIVVVSQSDSKLALKHRIAKASKLVTIHNGISDSLLEKNYAEHNKIPQLVMVARFTEQKNYKCLLEAVSRIEDKFALTLVGEGPNLASSKALTQDLGLSEKVDFSGLRNDIPEMLSTADVFLLISEWEGLPISILEAMRAKLPVIASNVGGVGEAVDHGINGLLVDRGDVDGLTDAIIRLIRNPGLRKQFGQAGRLKYEAEFSAEVMLSQLKAQYRSLGVPAG